MQNLYRHKRMYSDIPNIKNNHRDTLVFSGFPAETKLETSRETIQYNTNIHKSVSKGKERNSTPNQKVRKESESKGIKKILYAPKIKNKIGNELMNVSGLASNKLQTKSSNISPFQKKLGIGSNPSNANSRNTSSNRMKPTQPMIIPLNKFKNIPMIKNYLPPNSKKTSLTNREDSLNLTNLSKNDINNSYLTSDRPIRKAQSNSKSASKNSSKSRSGTPKFKNNTIKKPDERNFSGFRTNIANASNLNNSKSSKDSINQNNNQTLLILKSASNSKSPRPEARSSNISKNKIKDTPMNIPKKPPMFKNKIPKIQNYTAIHGMNKIKNKMNSNCNINKKSISNSIDANYSHLYHSLINKSNNYLSTNTSKINNLKDFGSNKISNNPSNNSIVSNQTNVTKEKDKNEFTYNIPFKFYDKDVSTTCSKTPEAGADGFKSDVRFKEITTSPLIRAKHDVNIPGRIMLDSKENKTEGKNLFELFRKIEDPNKNLNNQNPIPINIDAYLKKIKSNRPPVPTKKNIKVVHEFSHIGYADDGSKKVNQDNYIKYKNLGGNANQIFFGVCDGHGLRGHEVSGFLKDTLPDFLDKQIQIYSDDSIESIIEEAFLEMNFYLHTSDTIDTLYSGSTCVSLVYTPEKLICANVGDSRAVLGKFRNGKWINYDLTRDHKPSEKDEAQRIYEKGGRIEPFRDDDTDGFIGPPRVWLKDRDVPGLAMSRSFGDQVASSVGVIAEPEITEYKFVDEDKFIIIASDGVWEFIESDECVEIIKEFYIKKDPVKCCEFIYQEACKRWMEEEECIDDITMILIFLED